MVSAHEEFRNRRIKLLGAVALGFVVFAVGGLLSNNSHAPPWIAIAGFAAAFISMMFFQYGFRCPRCRKLISAVNTPGTSFLSFPNFCSNCGLDFSTVNKNNEPI
jgi:hypothetical protein